MIDKWDELATVESDIRVLADQISYSDGAEPDGRMTDRLAHTNAQARRRLRLVALEAQRDELVAADQAEEEILT